MEKEIVFAKQPILDGDQKIVGFELLFRNEKERMSDIQVTSLLLTSFVSGEHTQTLQGKPGFVNMDEVLIKSGAVEVLSPEHFVIEVLENVEILHVIERLERYKKDGYTIALDDFVANDKEFEKYLEFFYLFDIVKFDILDTDIDEQALPRIVESLKNFGIKLLAEKVESEEQYRRYRDLGFDYFQGYYFMEPQIARQKMMMTAKSEILQIWSMGDEEFDLIVEKLKASPKLSLGILKLLNSSFFNLQKEVSSVQQALAYLGMRNLKRWLLLMIYAQEGTDIDANPWVALSVSRAQFLSAAAKRLGLDSDKAHFVGMLSVLSETLGSDREEFLRQLPALDEEIKAAITHYHSPYGKLLQAAKRLERGEFDAVEEEALELGIVPQELQSIYAAAL